MSGNPRPKGREFNPKSTLVGTQALRVVNYVFIGTCGLGTILATVWLKYGGIEKSTVFRTIRRYAEDQDYTVDVKVTQARLAEIRNHKLKEQDPYYKHTEKRRKLGLIDPAIHPASPPANQSSPHNSSPNHSSSSSPPANTKTESTPAVKSQSSK